MVLFSFKLTTLAPMKLFVLAMLLVVTVTAGAQKKTEVVAKHSFDKSVSFKKETQDRFNALKDKLEELQAAAKLVSKNDDVKGIINLRASLLFKEFQDQWKTFYEVSNIDYSKIERDSIGGETLFLQLKDFKK